MIVIDSNVMIAMLDSGDPHFTASRNLFRTHVSERLVAHRLTIAESLVVAARANLTLGVASALATLGIGRLDEPDDPVELATLRAVTGLRMPDACVVLAAQRDNARLATFDRRLAGAARSQGIDVVGAESAHFE